MRAIYFVVLLSGCARLVAIDYNTKPPSDWPLLKERITKITPDEMPKYCAGLGSTLNQSISCAVTRFRIGVCDIYLTTDDSEALRHERAHCAGYGHVGNAKAPAEAWERFKDR